MTPSGPPSPTLALLELGSLARGYLVADALVKAAAVNLLTVTLVSPGKLLLLYTGTVGDVETAHEAGCRVAGDDLIDSMFLPQIHADVVPALLATPAGPIEALGLIECRTVAAGLLSADAAAKAAEVRLLSIRAARGIGGRTLTLFTGNLHDVEVSLAAGTRIIEGRGGPLAAVSIPRPHSDVIERLSNPTEVL